LITSGFKVRHAQTRHRALALILLQIPNRPRTPTITLFLIKAMPQFKEFFYIANIIDYVRILLLVIALSYRDSRFCFFYAVSYLLDCVDGKAAAYFNQKSKLGYWLDMIIDRVSSCICLYVAADVLYSGPNIIPHAYIPYVTYTFYFCIFAVEIMAHGVVCYYADFLGIHQKELGLDNPIVYLYLNNMLFFSCLSYELLPLTIIMSVRAGYEAMLYALVAVVASGGFAFRSLANLCRVWACLTLKPEVINQKRST